jgi:pyruvate,water dikinase
MEQAAVRERDLPADVAADLLSSVRAWGDVPLAVRSSGVDEDGAHASYAGLFTSVLNVRGTAPCSTRCVRAGVRHPTPA